jgi:hypothetical protein
MNKNNRLIPEFKSFRATLPAGIFIGDFNF